MRQLISTALLMATVGTARAQAPTTPQITAGLSAGATYYCIVSRCNTGTTVGLSVDIHALQLIAMEFAVRRHFCFDCHQFVIADAAVVVGYPKGAFRPFLAAGVSRNADPEFMGTHVGPLGAAGAWVSLSQTWATKLELRGRQVRRGDAIGELSVSLACKFGGSPTKLQVQVP